MELTNHPADNARKVYCGACKYFDPHLFQCCLKIVGYTDTPTCRRPEYIQCEVANKFNDCRHYGPKPEPQPKKSFWKKLFER